MDIQKAKAIGESVDGRYSDQQRYVYERMTTTFADVQRANEALSSRASLILGSSTALLAVLAFPAWQDSMNYLHIVLVVVSCGLFVCSATAARSIWLPSSSFACGSSDPFFLFEEYIECDCDNAMFTMMLDLQDVIEHDRALNEFFASRVRLMVHAIDAQAIILVLAFLAAFLD